MQVTCDFIEQGTRCGAPADHEATADAALTEFHADLCATHLDAVRSVLTSLGCRPSKARIGPAQRGVYVAASGAKFTARDARAWLTAAGHDLSPVGKLTRKQLELYAYSH